MANPVVPVIDLMKNLKKGLPVQVVLEYGLFFISPGGNVIDSPEILNAKGPSHRKPLSHFDNEC
jgi:hypothetical protein